MKIAPKPTHLNYNCLRPQRLTEQQYSRFTRYQKFGALSWQIALFYGGGYALGIAFKIFMHALSQGTPGTRDIDLIGSRLSTAASTRIQYAGTWAQMKMQGHHFGVFGALICLFEQPLELVTGSKGFVSGFFGGGMAGALVSWSQFSQTSRLGLVRRFTTQGLFIGLLSWYMQKRE